MSTYSNQDFERIAETIAKSPAHVRQYANRFEAAAVCYRRYCRAPKGLLLADTAKRLGQVAKAARELLRQLEIYDYRNASDGPGDLTLLEFLASAETSADDSGEDKVVNATAQIGRLAEIFAAIDAAREFARRGHKASEDARHLGRLVSIKGRRGDYAGNMWLAEMMSIYEALTDKLARISLVGGKPSGPFYRFLQAASRPVEFEGKPLSLKGLRERVRALARPTPPQ